MSSQQPARYRIKHKAGDTLDRAGSNGAESLKVKERDENWQPGGVMLDIYEKNVSAVHSA